VRKKAKQPGRILVVDDEESARSLLDRVLTGAGHQVISVETGEAGLDVLTRERVDLIITDKNLPGMDGVEMLRLAREQQPHLRGILITGYPTPESEKEALMLGIHAYVEKPFGILDILETCDAAIAAVRSVPPAEERT
jgi:CheY-like chemotaxis protein